MYRKEKRIPTIVALLIIFSGVFGAVFFDKAATSFTTLAKPSLLPKEVHITDISEKSFTVSWMTAEPATGSVVVSNNIFSATFLDDLDSDNIPRPRIAHYVTVKNLTEDSSYNIKIISGNSKCASGGNCPVYIQKTPIRLPTFSSLPPVKGQVVTKEGKPANTAIVYLMIGKSAPISGRVDSSGLWVIPFTNLRSADLVNRPDLAEDDIVQITVKASLDETATAVTDVKTIRQNLTLPTMQLGNSYNFINLISKKDLFAKNYNDQQILGTQTKTSIPTPTPALSRTNTNSTSSNKILDFIFPDKDGAPTYDNRPRLRGIGPKGVTLNITVNSTPQTGKAVVGSDGTWTWRPAKALSPGTHTITIYGYDKNGKPISETRSFIVLKSGESVLGEATASASLTPSATAAPVVTVSPTPIATASPTISPSPTSLPSATPIPPPPPPTGNLKPALLLFGASSVLLLIGAKLLFLP